MGGLLSWLLFIGIPFWPADDVEEVEIKLGDIGHEQSVVSVMCQAKVSNPPPVINIYLDDRKIVDTVVVEFLNHADQCSKGCGPRYRYIHKSAS